MPDPSDSTVEQQNTIEELKERLATGRRKRSDAVNELVRCAEEVSRGTPADSSRFYVGKPEDEDDTSDSGVRLLPQEDQVQARKNQLKVERRKSQEVLGRLKQTSFQIVQHLHPDRLLDPEKVKEHLGNGAAPGTA
jgi:hypothetical protein